MKPNALTILAILSISGSIAGGVSPEIADCGLRIVKTPFAFFNLQSEMRNPQFHHQWRSTAA
jgi:hypothetical protein